MTRSAALPIALAAAAILLCGLPLAAVISDDRPAQACPTTTAPPTGVITGTGLRPIGRWQVDPHLHNAAVIVAVGQQRQIPPRGWVIAVATAITESGLVNLTNPVDHDSLGLFQQRPSQGWGTTEQILNPVYAATAFYDRLAKIPDWQNLDLTDAAQAVQRSAFPTRYATAETDAERIVAAVIGAATITDLPGATLVGCARPPTLTSGGWTAPVNAHVSSPYGPRGDGFHAGIDLDAPRHTIIRAATAGTVVHAGCATSTGNCDIDGAPTVKGCGWYVDLIHAGATATRYCHMVRRPDVNHGQTVTAGQPIGVVGTSGNSSGPHLHFEIHTNVTCDPAHRCRLTRATSVEPTSFLHQMGVNIGPR